MNARRVFTVLLFSLFFILSSFSLFAAEKIPELLERWLAVENALYNWQNAAETSPGKSTADKLLASLEQFNKILEDFTGSLLFRQYEGTGLLPEGSGKITAVMTRDLIASVKAAERQDALSLKLALTQEADAIRRELYSWSGIDTQISSNVFLRSIYIFGVFAAM